MKKLLALTLVLVTVVSLFAGCGGGSDEIVLPKLEVEETYENRVAAMIATAWAFYDKNPYMQYGNDSLTVTGSAFGNRGAEWMNNTPEMAGPQRSNFHVCSRYCYGVTWHTFDLPLLDSWTRCSAVVLGRGTDKDLQPYLVWHHTSDGNKENDLKAMEEFFATVQVGDIISYERYHNTTGHAVIWAGDCDGDGDPDILNVDGKPYDRTTGEDVREDNGAVDINVNSGAYPSGDYFFRNENAYDYFPKLKQVSILRPADVKHAAEFPISDRAKTRLLFPRLAAFFEAEDGIYGSAVKGGEYTFTLRLVNNSTEDHEGILVQLPTPTNAEIVKVNDAPAKNKIIKLNVDLPAGQEVQIPYTVKATGNVGDLIETGVGYVHTIPLPSLKATIISRKADAAKVKAAIETAKNAGEGQGYLTAYLKEMGLDAAVPTVAELQERVFARKNVGDYKVMTFKTAEELDDAAKAAAKLIVPDYFGGTHVITESESLRVKELFAKDLQAGDILVWQKDAVSEPEVAIHDGENLLRVRNGKLSTMEQWHLDELYIYRFFAALRPTQVQ